MAIIAIIHLLWLLLVPMGIALIIHGLHRRKRWHSFLGTAALLLSLPALFFCTQFWPLDFLLPKRETRLPVACGAYQVTLIHAPGDDFYDTGFEVRRADGKIARVLIDGDDIKWWFAHTVTVGNRVYFVHGTEAPAPHTPCLDLTEAALLTGYTDLNGLPFKMKLDSLDFSSALILPPAPNMIRR